MSNSMILRLTLEIRTKFKIHEDYQKSLGKSNYL